MRSAAALGVERLRNRALALLDSLRLRLRRRRSREQSYRDEIATLRIALNHVGRGIQMIDGNGIVVVSNNRAAELLGVPIELLSRRPHFREVFEYQCGLAEFGDQLPAIKARFANGQIVNRSERYRRTRPNGQVIEVESVPLDDGGVVRTHTDVTDRHEAEQRINFLAHHDFLTLMPNRASFHQALAAALSGGQGGAIALIDVDNFKRVNDTLGHNFGDALLKEVARRLREAVRPDDLVARLGGDELALLISPTAGPSEVQALAEAVVTAVRRPFSQGGRSLEPSVSIGLTLIPQGAADDHQADNLLRQADLALYDAKQAGRNGWRLFDPAMMQRELAEQTLLRELRTAITEQQFEIFYQPIVDVRTLAVTGFEALIRWHHPSRGLLPASEFIAVVESSGLIVPLGSWVLRQACRDAAGWPGHIRLLVNLSPRQLSSPELVSGIEATLAETGLPPTRLELEITESSILHASEPVKLALNELRASSVRVALDDFGTGYSSLSHIRTLHFDTIKIDRSFVADASVRIDCGAIVKAVSGIAHDLGIETIAEGVETAEQLEWIRAAGCDEAQGYLFSRPVPLAAALALLTKPLALRAHSARPHPRSSPSYKPRKSSTRSPTPASA